MAKYVLLLNLTVMLYAVADVAAGHFKFSPWSVYLLHLFQIILAPVFAYLIRTQYETKLTERVILFVVGAIGLCGLIQTYP